MKYYMLLLRMQQVLIDFTIKGNIQPRTITATRATVPLNYLEESFYLQKSSYYLIRKRYFPLMGK